MNQITQIEKSQAYVPSGFDLNSKASGCLNYLLLALRASIKSIVRETMEEVLLEQGYKAQEDDRTLTAHELCERWSISPNTLRNWEIDKKIAPLPLNGRKKIYSMKDVLAAEAAGYIKNVA